LTGTSSSFATTTAIAQWSLRIGFLLALLFGLGFWTGIIPANGLVVIHMLLGLIVVAALWGLGLLQAVRGGSLGLTAGTFVYGLIVAIYGLTQRNLWAAVHNAGGITTLQILHLLLGIGAIGLGEMCAGRIRRATAKAA
jgi:hypothetical protein